MTTKPAERLEKTLARAARTTKDFDLGLT